METQLANDGSRLRNSERPARKNKNKGSIKNQFLKLET